ncbi:MAG: endolytic transglycosylase MltG [Candidatus Sericytochromatia bacterium]
MKFIKRLLLLLTIIALIILSGLVYGYTFVIKNIEPVNPNDKSKVFFNISEGEPLNNTLKNLEQKKLIKDYNSTKIYSMLYLKGKSPKPGKYQLSKSMNFNEIFKKLVAGDVYRFYVTIPEGYSIKKMAKRFEKNGFSLEEYKNQAYNVKSDYYSSIPFINKEKIYEQPSFEGYLFPDTYDVADVKEKDIVYKQLKRFNEVIYDDIWQKRPSNWHLSFNETVTLASIVELEAQKPEERDIIAGVFINRLKQGIPLGSDPTVEYALGWHQGDKGLTFQDIKIKSPYNTYINAGLPPGAIANAGAEVFKAVLNYKNTPYLYFVAKGDGSHVFTSTYDEHLRAQSKIVNGN